MEKDPNILQAFLLAVPATIKFTSSKKYHHVQKCIFFYLKSLYWHTLSCKDNCFPRYINRAFSVCWIQV